MFMHDLVVKGVTVRFTHKEIKDKCIVCLCMINGSMTACGC